MYTSKPPPLALLLICLHQIPNLEPGPPFKAHAALSPLAHLLDILLVIF